MQLHDPGRAEGLDGKTAARYVVIENAAGQLVGVEVKAVATIRGADLRGLKMLASVAGDQLQMGVMLCDGTETAPLGEGFWAAPLSSLWL